MDGTTSVAQRNSAPTTEEGRAFAKRGNSAPRLLKVALLSCIAVVLVPLRGFLSTSSLDTADLTEEQRRELAIALGDEEDEGGKRATIQASFQPIFESTMAKLSPEAKEQAMAHFVKLGRELGSAHGIMEKFNMPERVFRGSPSMRCIADLIEADRHEFIADECSQALKFALHSSLNAVVSMALACSIAYIFLSAVQRNKSSKGDQAPAVFWNYCGWDSSDDADWSCWSNWDSKKEWHEGSTAASEATPVAAVPQEKME
eukprot:TRINITY_DN46576_c0_g1_i1.p1 TRINITY_DN46576_c0_g1~~TRINITY_DN46576_c0_g1_i1.p1  ORF type:complete len:259 (+),score=56.34 TRINITY_DN46576_c0_g1_i1:280-1056(+)